MPAKTLLIESTPYLSRVALLEEGRLVEVEVERPGRRGVVGNIYKGRVSRVLPGMEAAFVDLGIGRDAFLFAGDADRLEVAADHARPEAGEPGERRRVDIEKVVREGQEILVQAVKDPVDAKGARITSQITLPGRFLVLVPSGDRVGVSRRIVDADERARLEELGAQLRPRGSGLIVRTAAAGRSRAVFERELAELDDLWRQSREAAAGVSAPALVHQDLDLVLRAVRDLADDAVREIWVEGEAARRRVEQHFGRLDPGVVAKVLGGEGLFRRFGVEAEIESALRRVVRLDSGGFLVIHPTEALVAIDVNSGRFLGRRGLEETALATNLEAAREAARQIRLRDLAGIIVIDFIDLEEPANRDRVIAALDEELTKDRAKLQTTGLSEFGLVQITRERDRVNLERQLTRSCPECRGRGRIRSPLAIGLEMREELLRRRSGLGGRPVAVRLHPHLKRGLEAEEGELLLEIGRALGGSLRLVADPGLPHHGFEIEAEERS